MFFKNEKDKIQGWNKQIKMHVKVEMVPTQKNTK